MNPQDTENHDTSKRKFLSTAVKVAYIAPLVMSLPANAHFSSQGSNCDNKTQTFTQSSFTQDNDDNNEHHHHR
jgi:hypothetical protein